MSVSRSRRLPDASVGLVSSGFGDEFVVVDPRTGVAHALSGDFALVWAAVQTRSWPHLDEGLVLEVVAELQARGLLADGDGFSRRTVLKAGAVGGASIALLGLTSMVLPSAAMATSEPLPVAFQSPGVQTSNSVTDTFAIQAGATVAIALVGGGGTGWALGGGAGGPGQVWQGTVENTSSSPVQVTFSLGGGGNDFDGAGGTYGGSGGGGGGGGASTLYLADGTVLAVAAGGGGSGGSNGHPPNSGHVNSGLINGATGVGGGGGGGTATGGDTVYGGGAGAAGNTGDYAGYAGSTSDTGVGYSTYGGSGGSVDGLNVTYTGNPPSNYVAPTAGTGSSPGSGGPPGGGPDSQIDYYGYQGGIYVVQTS